MVRISVPANKFRGEDQKKDFRREILALILAFNCVFRPGTRLYARLREGGTSNDLGGHGPKCPPRCPACVDHAIEYVIATCLLQARKHQFLNPRSTYLSKLDDIIAGA